MNITQELNYENINTPEELLKFMDSIEYGFADNENNRYGSWNQDEFEANVTTKWHLSSKDRLLETKIGHCFDQVELERSWFEEHNYQIKTYYMMFLFDHENDFSTHTFLIYKKNNKYYVFEHSDYNNRGIFCFDTLEEALIDKKNRHIAYNKTYLEVTEEDINHLHIYEYENPIPNSTFIEFINNILAKGKDVTPKGK